MVGGEASHVFTAEIAVFCFIDEISSEFQIKKKKTQIQQGKHNVGDVTGICLLVVVYLLFIARTNLLSRTV